MRKVINTLHDANRAIRVLMDHDHLRVDTETTGLHPYKDDVLFSVIISTPDYKAYYFNFNEYPDIEGLKDPKIMKKLFADPKYWVFHNAKFDLAFLAKEGLRVKGVIIDTQVLARLECNDLFEYSLKSLGQRFGAPKDDKVEEWIRENKAWEWDTSGPRRVKKKFYNEVPFDIISEYGIQDGITTAKVYEGLAQSLQDMDAFSPPSRPKLKNIMELESALTPVLFDMERVGVQIDTTYCSQAAGHYTERLKDIKEEFKNLTGHDFVKGTNLFKELFKDEKIEYSEKGNPKFDAKALKTFKHPAAALVLKYAEYKKQLEYFEGFLSHCDSEGVIHTNFKQSGTTTGRLSSSNPNLQNLTSKDKYEQADDKLGFTPRAAFVPREGYFFAMLDYQQAEYRAMLDMADCHGLIDKVIGGTDVHQATADIAGISRKDAKTCNFAILYSSGIKNIANTLGVTVDVAQKTREAIFQAAPEIKQFIRQVIGVAEKRGYIFNSFGRRSQFPDKNFAYKSPNHLIQGLCADICKTAMVRTAELLEGHGSILLLTIHDELVFEIKYGEEFLLPKLAKIMEEAYEYKRLPQGVDIEYSTENLAYKKPWEGFVGEKGRDGVQGVGEEEAREATQHMDRENTASHH